MVEEQEEMCTGGGGVGGGGGGGREEKDLYIKVEEENELGSRRRWGKV